MTLENHVSHFHHCKLVSRCVDASAFPAHVSLENNCQRIIHKRSQSRNRKQLPPEINEYKVKSVSYYSRWLVSTTVFVVTGPQYQRANTGRLTNITSISDLPLDLYVIFLSSLKHLFCALQTDKGERHDLRPSKLKVSAIIDDRMKNQ